jgi:hypothetical protein
MTVIDKTYKIKVLKNVRELIANPMQSTEENLTSIPIVLSQLVTLQRSDMLDLEEHEIENILKVLIEEMDRRSLDKTKMPMTANQACKLLYPNLEEDLHELISESLDLSSNTDVKEEVKANLEIIKKKDQEDKKDEEMKTNIPQYIQDDISINVEALKNEVIKKLIKQRKWSEEFDNTESEFNKLIVERTKSLYKYQFWMKHYSSFLLDDDNEVHKRIARRQLPYSDVEIAAIVLQNMMYPKSSQKKTAIEKKEFVQINSKEAAEKFLANLIKTKIGNDINIEITKAKKKVHHERLQKLAQLFCTVEHKETGAAILYSLKKGRGDMNVFLQALIDNDSKSTLNKIKLLTKPKYDGMMLLSDKKVKKRKSRKRGRKHKPNKLSQKKVFRLWLHCCRKNKLVDEQKFFKYFQEFQEKREWWNQYFDENGEPIVKRDEAKRERNRGRKSQWRVRRAASRSKQRR